VNEKVLRNDEARAKEFSPTMFIENRKQTVLSVALTALGLASATTVLLAYPLHGVARSSASVPETSQGLSERLPNSAQAKPASPANIQPRDIEKDLIRLAELEADADLLEITLDGQKASILRSFQFVSGHVSRYAVQDRVGGNDWQQTLQKASEQLAIDRESYRKTKIKLTLLRYQIARESKALGVSLDASVPLTELNHRFDRLEEKIDRLTGTLPGKAAQ
jgi:hypothetical protein